MSKKNIFVAFLSLCIGVGIGIGGAYRFYTNFIDQMLNLRFTTELAQDIATYRAMKEANYDKVFSQLRIRMAGDVTGLQGQCDRLSPVQMTRADDLFKKLRDLGLDASTVPVSLEGGGPIENCSRRHE